MKTFGINSTATVSTTASEIKAAHFGINHAFDFEKLNHTGTTGGASWMTFDEIAVQVSPGNIRYQGGSGAEKHFYLTNDEHFDSGLASSIEANATAGDHTKITPLDTFLNFCASQGATASIIIPVRAVIKEVSSGKYAFDQNMANAVKDFVYKALEEAEEQGAEISAFELGNEWETALHDFVSSSGGKEYLDALEYGEIASNLAVLTQEAIDDYKSDHSLGGGWDEPDITVQVYVNPAQNGVHLDQLENRNNKVMQFFDPNSSDPDIRAAAEALDAVTGHFYFKEGLHSGEGAEFGHYHNNLDDIIARTNGLLDAWKTQLGDDIKTGYSEWNVAHKPLIVDGGSGVNVANYGLKQLPEILSMFSEFTKGGVDSLDFWSTQFHETSLGYQQFADLSLTGELFKHIRENVVGTTAMDLIAESDWQFDSFTFASEETIVIYASSMVDVSKDITFDFSDILGDYNLSKITSFGVDDSGSDGQVTIGDLTISGLDYWGEGDLPAQLTNLSTDLNGGSFTHEFVPYELLAFEFQISDVIPVGVNTEDAKFGTFGNDQMATGSGSDYIVAWGGDDTIWAGSGQDVIKAGSGHDVLNGEAGNDTYWGGKGDDVLRFSTGGGDDLIGDYEDGHDSIVINGVSYQDIGAIVAEQSYDIVGGNFVIQYGSGDSITIEITPELTAAYPELFAPSGDQLILGTTGDDTLVGGTGNDTITGGKGYDLIRGGAGDDLLNGSSQGNSLFGEDGNDTIHTGKHGSTVDGGSGDDHIIAQMTKGGGHVLTGGDGADVFEVRYASRTKADFAAITDFDVDEDTLILLGQEIDLSTAQAGITLAEQPGGLQVAYGDNDSVFLEGVSLGSGSGGGAVGVVDGTSSDDMINSNFIDAEGDQASDGNDTIHGNEGNDTIFGYKGYDVIHGGAGDDKIYGSSQSNTLYGDAGDDIIDTGGHGSTVDGGGGADHIFASMKKGGGHVLTGGAGADIFEFRYASSSKVDDAIITDFDIVLDTLIVMGQTIDMSSLPAGFTLADTGDDMKLSYGDDDFVVFQGVSF